MKEVRGDEADSKEGEIGRRGEKIGIGKGRMKEGKGERRHIKSRVSCAFEW